MSFDLVVLSLEGVLVDSERLVAETRAERLSAAGLPISADELLEDYAGQPFKDVLLSLEKRASVPLQATLLRDVESRVDVGLARALKPVDGAREALAALGGRYCAVSDEPLARVRAMLETAGLLPLLEGRIFTAPELEAKPRPAADLYRAIIEKTGVTAQRCFAVEGSVPGIRAARAAGLRAVGFTGASQSLPGLSDRLTEAGAETVLRRLSELAGVLAALASWPPID